MSVSTQKVSFASAPSFSLRKLERKFVCNPWKANFSFIPCDVFFSLVCDRNCRDWICDGQKLSNAEVFGDKKMDESALTTSKQISDSGRRKISFDSSMKIREKLDRQALKLSRVMKKAFEHLRSMKLNNKHQRSSFSWAWQKRLMKEKAAFIKNLSKKFLLRAFLSRRNTKISQKAGKKTFKERKNLEEKILSRVSNQDCTEGI